METNDKTAQLGTENISKLLISYSLPAIAAQIAASVYNVIDSIFIGRGVGPMAISGLGITLPLMNLAAAFGALVGAGGATLMSIKLGQRDHQAACKVLGNVFALNVIFGLGVMIFGLVFLNKILYVFGASDETLPYAKDFMVVLLAANVFTHLYMGLNHALRSSGFPKKAMYITLLTVVVNFVLAPLFIFVFHWGIRGAALATALAQISAFVVLVVHFADKNKPIRFIKKYLVPDWDIVKGIISIGMSPFMMNICACLVVIIINNQLKTYGGDYAIGAYGIVNRVLMLFAMLVMGFNQGMQPIAGFNFGAKLYDRVNQTLVQTIKYATGVMLTAFAICELFPNFVCSLFTVDEKMISMSAHGMRIMVAAFPIVGFQMVTSNFFQCIGKAFKAVILSTTRQMLFLVPLLLILPGIMQLDGVWWALPISDGLSTFLAAYFLIRQFRIFKTGAVD